MISDAVGGVWQYTLGLAAGLAHYGSEIMVATMGPRPTDAQKRELLSIPHVTLVESDFALEWMPNPWPDVDAAARWLIDIESAFDADVIHLNGYAHAGLAWGKPVVVATHSCVFSWWRAVYGCAPDAEWAEYKRRVTAGLDAADLVIAPSRAMADSVEREYHVDSHKVRVIHNFTRTQISATAPKQNFILSAGRMWDPAKNLELLDSIAPQLDWEIRIAGSVDGPQGPGTAANYAHLLGPLPHDDLIRQMNRAAIFAHPALYEPFGLSVLEAARASCCLVLSDIPSLRELWENAAVFIDARDCDRWAAELNRLSRNPEERTSLGRHAHAHSMKYCSNISIEQYWRAYQAAINSNAGVAA